MVEVNKNLIKNQIREVIKYSQGIDDPKVDNIVDTWYANKYNFIEAFGGLTYKVPISPVVTKLSEKEQLRLYSDWWDKIAINFGPNIYESIHGLFGPMPSDWFFDNKIKKEYHGIPKGMKFTKALKYAVKDKDILDYVQQLTSQYIQRAKITGDMYFSVHPLDYLSSSETTLNWRSCHSLDGQYRAGNFSYMLDKATVVCYVCANEPAILPRFPSSIPWNNKKWRMLLFVSDERNALFAGRQYPFDCQSFLETTREYFTLLLDNKIYSKELFDFNTINVIPWTYWHNLYWDRYEFDDEHGSIESGYLSDRWLPMQGKMRCMSKLVLDNPNTLNYDDLLHSTVYLKPWYCWKTPVDTMAHFHIGSEVPCLRCGEEIITSEGTMLCEDCLNKEAEEW